MISIQINVTSASEAIAALEELKIAGYGAMITSSPAIAKANVPAVQRDEYKQVCEEIRKKHGRRFHPTQADYIRIANSNGQVTKITIAREALAQPVSLAGSDDSAEPLSEFVPDDDGEDTFS